MNSNTVHNPAAITSAVLGTLAGFYKAVNAGTIVQTVLLTALSAAVSCIVSFYLQQWLRRFRR